MCRRDTGRTNNFLVIRRLKDSGSYPASPCNVQFVLGETAKTISVAVLDDAIDEGDETLFLMLVSAQGGRFADGLAVGTITNTDHMPQAWLARFGRTVAGQVVDAVEARFGSAPQSGVQVTLAGERIGGAARSEEEDREADPPPPGNRLGSRVVAPRELLTGSSFALSADPGAMDGGVASVWGRGAWTRFDGRQGELSVSGEVTNAMLGLDWAEHSGSGGRAGRWTAGLMLSHALAEGSYRGASAGTVESTVTGLYPYGRYAMTDRVTVWGVAGQGAGTLTLTPEDGAALRTDLKLGMAAAGLRGVAVKAPPGGGPELAVETDAMAVRTSSDAVTGSAGGNLAAAAGEATRLRLGLVGSWRGLEVAGGTLAPKLEVGARHDCGDAETGFGLDAGAGLVWSDASRGLRADLLGRGILTHDSDGLQERGFAGSLSWQPRPERGLGPKLSAVQTLGGSATGGMRALLSRRTLSGLAPGDDDPLERRRLEVRFSYGFAAFGDRFTSTPELGFGMSNGYREYGLGWRLNLAQSGPTALEVRLGVTRREAAGDSAGAEPAAGLRLTTRW